MKPIEIPRQTIEAYGAEAVTVSAPQDFEFSDGSKPEAYPAMRVGEVVYVLIGVETQDEMEALKRTKCFYLGFFAKAIPIFNIRVADIIFGEAEPDEILPTISDNFDLHQEARDNWHSLPGMTEVCFKSIGRKSRFVQLVGQDDRHQDVFMADVVDAGDFLLHNFISGNTCVVSRDWLEFMYGEGWQAATEEAKNVSDLELQEPDDVSKEDRAL
jgi:hypothetical protein